ncbi:nitrite reductase, copper-containing [Colwellia sp. MB3u-4]|nr:nitrite reductase, copper-containing [Colwellia sp. MB3u-4]
MIYKSFEVWLRLSVGYNVIDNKPWRHNVNPFKKLALSIAVTTTLVTFSAGSYAGETLDTAKVGLASQAQGLERVTQILVAPPFLPKHEQVAKGGSKIIAMTMEVVEKAMEISPGAFVQAMTFEGSNPGPMIVAHVGDYVELTLKNPKTNTLLHNIDFHAATGALGGGALTDVSPGEQVVLRFKATKAGVFVYHCAPGGVMIPFHIVSGMNGAIMILPREGLKDEKGQSVSYDKAYYIGEQDWYVPKDDYGKYKRYNSPAEGMADTLAVMRGLIPTHITFNGKVGALTGENAMTAKVGETVLFLHSEANRDTRIHLIGGHGDLVWPGGSFNDTPITNQETWSVLGGSAVAAMYTFKQPGSYAYVNHNLIEAVMLGALAHVSVEGKWNNDLMEQVSKPSPIK